MKFGKGLFLWKVKNLYGGNPAKIDPQDIVQRAKNMNADWVAVKVAEGPWRYNLRPPNWTDDILPGVCKAFQVAGIPIWGWHFLYGDNPAGEAKVAIERVEQLKLDGYIMDVESQYKNKAASARIFMSQIVKKIHVPIGLASFRFPIMHPTVPWKEFLQTGTDFHMPQMYWQDSTNPLVQWERCKKELKALADLPFMPIGPAYYEHGWNPSVAEMTAFFNKVQSEGHPGISWWSWDQMELHNDMKLAVKAMKWKMAVPVPPDCPDCPECPECPECPKEYYQAIKQYTGTIRALLADIDKSADDGLAAS